ncbi:MAG: hypothetical protein WC910_09580, partial [Bacteroidales bacterium]
MPIVNGINLDEYDFGDSAKPDSLSGSPKQTVNGINLSEYDFGEEKPKTIAPSPEETLEASFLRRVPDLGVSLLKGAVGVPEAVVGLLDIPTMGYAGKAAEGAGIRFKETQEILDSLYSPQQQEANRKLSEAKGFTSTIGTAFENPSTILQLVAESAPSMVGAGGIGRGLIKFFPKLAPVIAGAAGEGLVSGGQLAEQVRQGETSGLLSAGQAGIAGLSGMLTGVLGVVGGKLAKRLGIVDIDTLIAGGSVRAAVDDATAVAKKNVLRKMIESAISEGAFEELPQSLQEQMAQNVATGRPATEGVAEAGALGMLAGGAMGAFGGAGGHVLSGMEILQKDKVNQDRSQEIQTFVANQGYADLNNNDLLQAYAESDAVQKDLPDDSGLSGSMSVLKSELEKRGIWPEDKLSVDIEAKMAELDAKLGGTVTEGSDLVRKTEGGGLDVEGMQTETEGQVVIPEPITPQGEDIITEPPMADTSKEIASSPSSFFSMPKIGTQNVVKAEKTPSTLPLTELSEEGMANPPSTPEKTSQEAIQEKTTVSDDFKDGKIKTLSGRVLAPPAIRTSSNVVATKDSKKADEWLRREAIEEAKAKGDEFAGDQFKMANPAKMTQAEREGMHDYLFGETKNIFVLESEKPLKKKAKSATKILKVFPDKENGLEVHVAKVEKGFSVAVMDVDSGKFFDEVKIYPTDKKAIEAAKAIIKKPKPEKKSPPTIKKSLTVQKEETLESYARKHKINFNIPGHTNKEAISDGLLSYTKNDAIGLDKRAEEMQGLGLLGTTPDKHPTAGDYLYFELQRIVYNRINKKAQSLTAEEDQAIKEMKEALKRDGYDESGIEREASESDRTGKKKAYSIKDSEAHGETQSLLEADEEFVKEEETPSKELFDTSKMFTLSGNQPVEQKTMKVPEKKGERLLDVEKQTTDELKDRLSGEKAKREFEEGKKTDTLKTSTGQRGGENEAGTSKTTPKDTASPVESDRSLEILRREFERELGKSLDMGWATQVRVPDVLAKGVGQISKVFGKEVIWVELADTTPFFNGVVSDKVPDKVFINAKTKEPYLFILGHEMLHKMKFESPELYASLLTETKKYLKDRKGVARLSELDREELYADFVGEAFTSEAYWNHLQKKNPTLFEKAIQTAKDIIDKVIKALNIDNISPKYLSDVKKAQTIIADIMDKYAKETGVNLKVGTVPKGELLSDKDSQTLVSDILSILADGSSINFVGKIDPNRPDIQKALTQWKQGNPGASFVIEGMHRKVIVDGNTMASIIEVSMGSSDIGQTAWHEAWHSIDEIFLTANEKKILAEKLTPNIEKQADIFAKYAANQKHLLPKSAKPIFERIREFFE